MLGAPVQLMLALLGCAASSAAGQLERVDEIQYLAALQEKRPGLMQDHSGSVDDPAWQALVITPAYRAALLEQSYSTYEGLLAAEYDTKERDDDRAWAGQSAAYFSSLESTKQLTPFNDHDIYVGFRLGGAGPAVDDRGYAYKFFFGFAEFATALAPARLHELASSLVEHGFRGAMKIDLRPSATRFRYNQLVFYAATPGMVACGEDLVEKFYGSAVVRTARGIDPSPSITAGERLDWHHFLLTGAYLTLPPDLRDYVEYKNKDKPSCGASN